LADPELKPGIAGDGELDVEETALEIVFEVVLQPRPVDVSRELDANSAQVDGARRLLEAL
jgi:hypothetical protein